MDKSRILLVGVLALVCLTSCSKEPAQYQTRQAGTTGPSVQAAPQQAATARRSPQPAAEQAVQETAPASQPAQAVPVAPSEAPARQPSGPLAAEKHTLNVTNYAGTPVTISINGAWVGQWDTNSGTIPLESVVHGKNELTVELQGQPQNQVTVEVWAQRAGGWVNLLRLNFQGKTGTHAYSFAAR